MAARGVAWGPPISNDQQDISKELVEERGRPRNCTGPWAKKTIWNILFCACTTSDNGPALVGQRRSVGTARSPCCAAAVRASRRAMRAFSTRSFDSSSFTCCAVFLRTFWPSERGAREGKPELDSR